VARPLDIFGECRLTRFLSSGQLRSFRKNQKPAPDFLSSGFRINICFRVQRILCNVESLFMPWTYRQLTGELTKDNQFHGRGYSGTGGGRNNPAMQTVRNAGPIPQGRYLVGTPHDTLTHGPRVLGLAPLPGTQTFGRDGFLIHDDNPRHDASQGCIILDRAVRDRISVSGDDELQVVP
jgi:hypothetical protein